MNTFTLGNQISGTSSFVTNGITIKSNTTFSISGNINQLSLFKNATFTVEASRGLTASTLTQVIITSDDAGTDLITITGDNIYSYVFRGIGVAAKSEAYGYSVTNDTLQTIARVYTSNATLENKNLDGGIKQTSIVTK